MNMFHLRKRATESATDMPMKKVKVTKPLSSENMLSAINRRTSD